MKIGNTSVVLAACLAFNTYESDANDGVLLKDEYFPSPLPPPTHSPVSDSGRRISSNQLYMEYNYIGCYEDKKDDRVFSNEVQRRDATTDECGSLCWSSKYFMRQFKGQCFCGDAGDARYDRHGSSKDCDCDGENVGSYRGCVYEYVTRVGRTDNLSPTYYPTSTSIPVSTRNLVSDSVPNWMNPYRFFLRRLKEE
mmetsp:Transcript_36199/g.71256  ORF Transcript_36199/g.71256 Transcript_36199/m.71256 type:complete len:196 (+) Transcript_36199:113-700(+)